jgi:hypothetical protein
MHVMGQTAGAQPMAFAAFWKRELSFADSYDFFPPQATTSAKKQVVSLHWSEAPHMMERQPNKMGPHNKEECKPRPLRSHLGLLSTVIVFKFPTASCRHKKVICLVTKVSISLENFLNPIY